MSGTLSIVFVVLIVWLLFMATRPETRKPAARSRDQKPAAIQNRKRVFTFTSSGNIPIARLDELQRLRTDRLDLQTSIGRDFGAPELGDRIWPPIR